jgi:hypothetical protein
MIKSAMIWQRSACGKTNGELIRNLQDLGVNRVEIKVADNSSGFITPYNSQFYGQDNLTFGLAAQLVSKLLGVDGWAYVYGKDPLGEAQISSQNILQKGVTRQILDVEVEYFKYADRIGRVRQLLSTFAALSPHVIPSFCSFAQWENPVGGYLWWDPAVYRVAAEYCSIGYPMAYWQTSNITAILAYLDNVIAQWQEVGFQHVVPILRGWTDGKGSITPAIVHAVMQHAAEKNWEGVTWWSFDMLMRQPQIFNAIAEEYANL